MSETVRSYQDLIVWQKAMDLVTGIYRISDIFPDAEKYGLTAQLRRSAISIPSNIAEGNGRSSTPDYLRFLKIARGSLFELQTQLQIAIRLGYITTDSTEETQGLQKEVELMLNAIIRKLSSS